MWHGSVAAVAAACALGSLGLVSARCDPMHFDPTNCSYPMLDEAVSYRIDADHELTAIAWGMRDGVACLAAGDIDGDLYLWETGWYYLHPTRWNMLSGYITNNISGGEPFPQQTAHSSNKVGYDDTIYQMAWNPDGTKIAIASGSSDILATKFGQLTVFDTETMELVAPTLLPQGCVNGSYHWHVVPYVNGTSTVRTPVDHGCYSGYSSLDKHQLGLADDSRVWVKQMKDVARTVVWSPDGTKIAIGFDRSVSGENYVILVNATTGEREVLVGGGDHTEPNHQSSSHQGRYSAHSLAWSPDGNWLAIGSDFVTGGIPSVLELYIGDSPSPGHRPPCPRRSPRSPGCSLSSAP
jgi:WD40 repeat protein